LRHGAPYLTPFASAEQLRLFFAQNPTAQRIPNFFLFSSAIPFGIFATTAVSRLRFLGVRAAGANIALFGGISAAIALFFSGMAGSILSVPDVLASAEVVKAVFYLSFLSGGVFYAVSFGLLAAGISVTSYFKGLLPRWIAALGIAVALAGELSSLSLIAYPANFFIPVARFAGFLWMLLAAFALMRVPPSLQSASAQPGGISVA
ncbi:MAG TPA: hypothetical protein VHE33_04395, partial [Acidobacteriaceae bacterium]|nr:hypothetical protein [Acidobacteriaceae bacterium]